MVSKIASPKRNLKRSISANFGISTDVYALDLALILVMEDDRSYTQYITPGWTEALLGSAIGLRKETEKQKRLHKKLELQAIKEGLLQQQLKVMFP